MSVIQFTHIDVMVGLRLEFKRLQESLLSRDQPNATHPCCSTPVTIDGCLMHYDTCAIEVKRSVMAFCANG